MGSRHVSQNSEKSEQVLEKTKHHSNIRASGGTIKREITTLLLALLTLGNRQVSILPPTVGGKVMNTLSKARGTWSPVCRDTAVQRILCSLFPKKHQTKRHPGPLASMRCSVGLLYPTRDFWFLTQKKSNSACLKMKNESPAH